jgi:hypothetical protein
VVGTPFSTGGHPQPRQPPGAGDDQQGQHFRYGVGLNLGWMLYEGVGGVAQGAGGHPSTQAIYTTPKPGARAWAQASFAF